MNTAKHLLILVCLLVPILLSGCRDSGPPPTDIIEGAVIRALDVKIYKRSFGSINGGIAELGDVDSIDITNEQKEESSDRTVYSYDYKALVTFNDRAKRVYSIKDATGSYNGTVSIENRNGTWFRID